MFREDLPIQSRQCSIRIEADMSGGPFIDYSVIVERMKNFQRRTNKNITATISRLENSKSVSAINITYMDGIEVRNGDVYYVRKAVFQTIPRPTLSVVK
jgi:hypothetical protein